MQKTCVCGKLIPNGIALCKDCREQYGSDSKTWPDWVKFLVADTHRVYRYEGRHRDEAICDDVFITPKARVNLQMAKQFPNMELEEFREYLHDTGNE